MTCRDRPLYLLDPELTEVLFKQRGRTCGRWIGLTADRMLLEVRVLDHLGAPVFDLPDGPLRRASISRGGRFVASVDERCVLRLHDRAGAVVSEVQSWEPCSGPTVLALEDAGALVASGDGRTQAPSPRCCRRSCCLRRRPEPVTRRLWALLWWTVMNRGA